MKHMAMRSGNLKKKNKNSIFVVQFSEDNLKILKCFITKTKKKEVLAFEVKRFDSSASDEDLAGYLKQLLKQLEYNNNPLIVVLARNQVTCRYIKIPATNTTEVEKIVPYQASKYLPYPLSELITSYQIISTDKEGYSYINLDIVHRSIIQRYVDILDSAGVRNLKIVLSSYGLCNLYSEIEPKNIQLDTSDKRSVTSIEGTQTPAFEGGIKNDLVINVTSDYVELAIVSQRKLVFSRSFKITKQQTFLQLLEDEIKKTLNVYLKETGLSQPIKATILSSNGIKEIELLSTKILMPVGIVNYLEKINCPAQIINKIHNTGSSLVDLIGLCTLNIPDSLNILPSELRQIQRKKSRRKELIKSAILMVITITVLGLAAAKSLGNKRLYRDRLKMEVEKISKEARKLEELEKRLYFFESRNYRKTQISDIIYELHKIMPQDIRLSNLAYEEGGQFVLRGQAAQLNSVFSLVELMENAQIFSVYAVKVKYATKKRTALGEIVDFEINCVKGK